MSTEYRYIAKGCFLIVIILFYSTTKLIFGQDTAKMMIIIIDGARYTETLGDPTHTYTPEMWNLTTQGTMVDNFKNDNFTYTSRAIPASLAIFTHNFGSNFPGINSVTRLS